jgi:hypothetical protein
MASSPLAPLTRPRAVSKDRQVLIWNSGGGAWYDPASDQWMLLPEDSPLVSPPGETTTWSAIWTGQDFLLWSVADPRGTAPPTAWVRYDPVSGQRYPLPQSTIPGSELNGARHWTGSQLVILHQGTRAQPDQPTTGIRINPTTGEWDRISTHGAPSLRDGSAQVWTGRELVMWGGQAISGGPRNPARKFLDGGRYDPVQDTWSPIAELGVPVAARSQASAVWTGREAIFWGGIGVSPGRSGVTNFSLPGTVLAGGARYRPLWLRVEQPSPVRSLSDEPWFTAQAEEQYRVVWVEDGWVLAQGEHDSPDWLGWLAVDDRIEVLVP